MSTCPLGWENDELSAHSWQLRCRKIEARAMVDKGEIQAGELARDVPAAGRGAIAQEVN